MRLYLIEILRPGRTQYTAIISLTPTAKIRVNFRRLTYTAMLDKALVTRQNTTDIHSHRRARNYIRILHPSINNLLDYNEPESDYELFFTTGLLTGSF